MKKVIIILIIFSLVFISFFTFKKEEKENKNISVILETEEGNIESNTFPSKNDYEYLSTECKNTSDNINTTFNEETWKLNLNVEEERIDGKFNCTVHFKENIKPNEPVLDESMVPVYYSDADSTWRVADKDNKSTEHKWYDYEEKMWANSVTYDHTKLIDLSSKNKDVTFSGPSYTNEGISFDGVDDYIDVGYENYDFGNKVTYIARFKVNEYTTSVQQNIISNIETSGAYLQIYSNKKIGFGIYGNNQTDYKYANTTYVAEPGKWYTAVGTYDGETIKLYINGNLEKSLDLKDTIKSSPMWIAIGENPNVSYNNGHMHHFNGTISDAIVINDVLTEEEIQENYSGKVNYKENDKTLFAYDLQGYEGREVGSTVPMEAISTMQVWIPRYKYKVWNYNLDGTKTSEPQEIEIKFEKGTNTTGEIKCTDNIQGEGGDGTSEVCAINNEECSDNLCNGAYYTHPAFTFGSVDLTGFWVGKFEVSSDINCTSTNYANVGDGCNLTTINPLVKPNLSDWRGAQFATFDSAIRNMVNETMYGFSSNVDTHMIKNSEWGAVAYLSHSKFGNEEEVQVNSTTHNGYVTGCGPQVLGSEELGTSCNPYNTELGSSASTTGNIYGVYDMSGGAWEGIMTNMVSPDGKTMMSGYNSTSNSGFNGIVYNSGTYTSYTGGKEYPEEKYYDKYSFYNGTRSASSAKKNSKLGDATKELVSTNTRNWYNDIHYSITANNREWFVRGGYLDEDNLVGFGIFSVGAVNGLAWHNTSTRVVLSIN